MAVLELQTLVPTDQIRIDGVLYDILRAGQMPLVDRWRAQKLTPRADELILKRAALTDDEGQELDGLLEEIVPLIVKAPPEVHGRLNSSMRLEILLTFTALSLGMRLLDESNRAEATESENSPTSTGASRPRASRASTRAPRRRSG